MSGKIQESPPKNWLDPEHYEGLLRLDRRGWAWPWVQRDARFMAAVADIMLPAPCILRREPPITVVTLVGQDCLEPWGLLFRRASSSRSGSGRLAGRL